MTHLIPSKNRKPGVLSGRISVAAFSAVAAAALMFNAGSAQAGPADLTAIAKELKKDNLVIEKPKAGQTLATFEQVLAAVQAAIANNPKLQPGNIAGEALKTPQAIETPDAGTTIANGVLSTIGGTPSSDVLTKLAGYAAKTAATSKGANALHVSPFVIAVLDSKADAIAAATLAKSSKTAVAAIIAGYALEAGGDKTALVNELLDNKNLVGSVTEISREISAQADVDSAAFAEAVSLKFVGLKKTNSILKVVPGIVSSNVEEAGRITDKLLSNATLNPIVNKGLVGYAKAVAAVADIEQISIVGAQLAAQIGTNAVKVTQAASLAKTLAQAIVSKPVPANIADLTAPVGKYSIENRIDEISEVAAFVVGGIFGNTALTNNKKDYAAAKSAILGIIKGAIAGSKVANKQLKPISDQLKLAANQEKLLAHIAGSVALTVQNSSTLSTELLTALKGYLASDAFLNAIAGKKDTPLRAAVQTAIGLGLAGNNAYGPADGNKFLEDGNVRDLNGLLALVDAETEIRNN